MEGIVLEVEALGTPWVLIGVIASWAVVVGAILLGRMADGERAGRRFLWAEGPFYKPRGQKSAEEELRKAA